MLPKVSLLQAISQLLFGILGALIINLCITHSSQKIATVDIKGIINSFEDEISKKKLSQEMVTQRVIIFSKSLNDAVSNYANKKNLILVPSEVVLAGDNDKTSEIKELIKKGMQ